ncbi:hypothetical protein FRC07_014770 [Ceratobasidium sp. 392]|nr:hypothetical protein FRC07_014770 [Ceratobasidium sp. 392]
MYEAHPDRPGMLNNLGVSYGRRFGHSGNLLDVDKAVELQTQAVSLTPDGHLQKPRFLTSLSFSISRRLENLGRTDDAELMLGYLRQAARSRSGPAVIRFANARQWAQMSKSPESSMDAHRTAMSLLPRLVWIGAAANRRYQDVASVGDLATEAAAAAIGAQQYSQALEWLEEGRAIVWGRQLQLRTPLDEICTADPTLAEKLEAVGKQLETGSSSAVRNSQATENVGSLEETARNHRRSAEEWDRLVAEARQIPGLENFLRPRKAEDLVLAARRGPVVVVNVHLSRCDALVLHPSQPEVTHVPLPLFSLEQATKAQSDWTGSLRSFGMRDRGFRKASVSKPSTMNGTEVLGLLWTTVVEPVLSHLGYLRIQPEESTLPRVTWCTTGPLSFLPIHAAGIYTQPSQPKIFHYVISSYAPTLSTLLSPPKQPNECRGLLAVGQDQTAGLSALPCAVEELEQIKQVAGDLQVTRLVGEEATVDAVLSGMKESSWVHLACHAIQDAENPTRSAFFLHDGRLDLATIAKGPVKEGGLAFLSACQTALGHKELPEEAIHLAAGMIMAGYPSVIATMWSIRDKHAPIIASQVYARLAKDGVPSTDRVAEALHAAVAYLRNEVGEDRFEDWAPFIHMGV